uniref:hypothetical protein n=1 Tax=Flavobacterium sp. TaxID=239 RepID=UPI00404ADE08
MNKILIFFRHSHFELWSIDTNNRLVKLDYLDSNVIPLYFLISGSDISVGSFAKEQFEKGIGESLGHFWSQLALSEEKIIRGSKSLAKKELLPTALFEQVFSELARNYFDHNTVEDIVSKTTILLCFEPFWDQKKSLKITELIRNKFFNSINIVCIDYWSLLFGFYKSIKITNPNNEKICVLGSYNSDLYCFLIEDGKQIDYVILEGKGIDPRLNAVSDFCIENIKSRGSLVDQNVIRSFIKKDVNNILSSLNKGLVEHVFDNPRIGVARFTLRVHKSVLDSRLENPSDLLLLESEVKSFRGRNNISSKIVLLTDSLNLSVFYNKFESIGFVGEPEDFNSELLKYLIIKHKELTNTLVDRVPPPPPPPPPRPPKTPPAPPKVPSTPSGISQPPTGESKAKVASSKAPPAPPKAPPLPPAPPKAPPAPPKAPPAPPKVPPAPPKAPPSPPKVNK